MKALMLLTDAYGGHGGIALYNRDVLAALGGMDRIRAVEAVPRIAAAHDDHIPDRVRWRSDAARSGRAFVIEALRRGIGVGRDGLIWCAHVNLLPVAALLRHATGARLILALYGTEAWARFERSTSTRALGAVDHVVSISRVTADRFQAWSGFPEQRLSIVANAIDLDLYGDGPRDPELVARYGLAGRKVVMIFGRMHPTERQKGFDELLHALPALRRRHPDVVALLVGDGEDRPRLEALAGKLGVASHVRFAGRIDDADKAAHYRLADAFVMPGRQEGFGFVHLEAMACGTPSVASRADGAIEAVAHGELGGLLDPDDEESIVAATLQALDRPRGVPVGLDRFAFPRFAREIEAAVERTLALTRRA